MRFSKLSDFFFPQKLTGMFFAVLYLKFMWFDLLWCMMSTFTPFSKVETYFVTAFVCLVLLLPLVCFRAVKATLAICVLLDCLLVSNLMYFRTYFTAIPLDSYLLVSNLSDFTGSVLDSLEAADVFFPLSTIAAGFLWWRKGKGRHEAECSGSVAFVRCVALMALVAVVPAIRLWCRNGFKAEYERLQDAYLHTCSVPMYTVFASLYYDYICDKAVYTPEVEARVDAWLAGKAEHKSALPPFRPKGNCVIILAESLESWVLNKTVEGQELTPYLNEIVADTTVVYAPRVLSQVKGGRSIDAQLLMVTGLLPISSGAYSIKFPDTYYPSLVKAFKEAHKGAKAYSLTTDKPMVWNQCIITPALGYDSLVSKRCFVQEEPVGSRSQVGDRAFLRQCLGKIRRNEVWDESGNTLVQCVTYSGHNPFILPDSLKRVSFSQDVPEVLRNYMTMANYTDRAIGEFVAKLKRDERFRNTLVVIMGDHEALGTVRKALCSDPVGRRIVSDKAFVPLIILNAPRGMHYDKVMGQVDVYPTLLDLLGLNGYRWRGMGESIFCPDKQGFGVDPLFNIVGDTTGVSEESIRRAKEAWDISDMIIRYDYPHHRLNIKKTPVKVS